MKDIATKNMSYISSKLDKLLSEGIYAKYKIQNEAKTLTDAMHKELPKRILVDDNAKNYVQSRYNLSMPIITLNDDAFPDYILAGALEIISAYTIQGRKYAVIYFDKTFHPQSATQKIFCRNVLGEYFTVKYLENHGYKVIKHFLKDTFVSGSDYANEVYEQILSDCIDINDAKKAFIKQSAELASHSNGFDQLANELTIKCCLTIEEKYNSNMLCFYQIYFDEWYEEGNEIIYKKRKLKEYLHDIGMI